MNRHRKPWVESMLVAYVDHQLDAAQTAAVDDIIREDAEARTIVSVLRGTGEAAREAFEQPLHAGVLEDFAELLEIEQPVGQLERARADHLGHRAERARVFIVRIE